jgi:hypothetical protein
MTAHDGLTNDLVDALYESLDEGSGPASLLVAGQHEPGFYDLVLDADKLAANVEAIITKRIQPLERGFTESLVDQQTAHSARCAELEARIAELTDPLTDEVIERFAAYNKKYPSSWGIVHVVMDDQNFDDDCALGCLLRAIEKCDPKSESFWIAETLYRLSEKDRVKLHALVQWSLDYTIEAYGDEPDWDNEDGRKGDGA